MIVTRAFLTYTEPEADTNFPSSQYNQDQMPTIQCSERGPNDPPAGDA